MIKRRCYICEQEIEDYSIMERILLKIFKNVVAQCICRQCEKELNDYIENKRIEKQMV